MELQNTPPGPEYAAVLAVRQAQLRPRPLSTASVRSLSGRDLMRAPPEFAESYEPARLAARRAAAAVATGTKPRRVLPRLTFPETSAVPRPTFTDSLDAPPPKAVRDFLKMVMTREAIRAKRAAGAPWPWSADPVLNTYKFTNVKREHDRATAWLRAEWTAARPDADARAVLFNCALFRTFGTVAFARAVGWTADPASFDARAARDAAVAVFRCGAHAFTRAYCRPRFNAERRASNEPPLDVYDACLEKLRGFAAALDSLVATTGDAKLAWRTLCDRLRAVKGFDGSGDMVLHDAMGWASVHNLVDDDKSWTPPGPGARRGLNRLHDRVRNCGALAPPESRDENHFVEEMRLLLNACIATEYAFCTYNDLNIHDVQSQLREYDKYRRIADNSRPPDAS